MEYAIALKQAADFWLHGNRLAGALPLTQWLVSSPNVLISVPNIGWVARSDNDETVPDRSMNWGIDGSGNGSRNL